MAIAFYYIDSSGTATGDAGRETTKRTGAFEANANNYVSVNDAILNATTSPVAGDCFLGASDSVSTPYTVSTNLVSPATGAATPALIISVDVANQENPLAGFSEGTSGSNFDLNFNGIWSTWGFDTGTFDALGSSSANSNITMQNATMTFNGSGDRLLLGADGVSFHLIDMILDFVVTTSNTTGVQLNNCPTLRMDGGSVISSTTGSIDHFISAGGANGGFVAYIRGVDLSIVDQFLVGNVGASIADDNLFIFFDGCQLNAAAGIMEERPIYQDQEVLAIHCSTTSGSAEHQFYYENYRGIVEDNTTVTRAASIAFPDSGQKISLKVTPDALCDRLTPFKFKIPEAFVALSNASTDTLQFFVTSGTQMTDALIWAEIHYPDGTNKNVYNAASGALKISGSYTIDPFGTGNVLTTDSSWTSGLTFEQTFKATSSGDVGSDSAPMIFIYVATTAVLHIDVVFDAVAS